MEKTVGKATTERYTSNAGKTSTAYENFLSALEVMAPPVINQ
jgi:hypothetical protein